MHPSVVEATIDLSNGARMPSVGLGTWQLDGADCETAVLEAIKLGEKVHVCDNII